MFEIGIGIAIFGVVLAVIGVGLFYGNQLNYELRFDGCKRWGFGRPCRTYNALSEITPERLFCRIELKYYELRNIA